MYKIERPKNEPNAVVIYPPEGMPAYIPVCAEYAFKMLKKMAPTKKIWIVTGVSESTDHYGPLAFSTKPSKSQLSKLAHSWDGDDEKQGPGFDGSYVDIDVSCVGVE